VGAEIARVEQGIHHAKEMRRQQQMDLQQIDEAWRELQQHIDSDRSRLQELAADLEHNEPALERLREVEQASQDALAQADERMQEWQKTWDEFTDRSARTSEEVQVERTRIDHQERHIVQLQQRGGRLRSELQALSEHDLEVQIRELEREEAQADEAESELQRGLEEVLAEIGDLREHNRELNGQLDGQRGTLQDTRGRLASLEALQQAALGQADGAVSEWLEGRGLAGAPRLAQELEVEAGWERAVETVLGFNLEAVCLAGMDAVAQVLDTLEHGALAVFDTAAGSVAASGGQAGTPLAGKVRAPWPVESLLGGVYVATDLNAALALRGQLGAHESVVTPDGVWIGRNWLRVARDEDSKAGVLAREQEIKSLTSRLDALAAVVGELEQQLEAGRNRLQELEQRREATQQQVNESHRRRGERRARLSAVRTRNEQYQDRADAMRRELEELEQQEQGDSRDVQEARSRLAVAMDRMEQLAQERERLGAEREQLRAALDETRARARSDREQAHALALRLESLHSQQTSTQSSLQRSEQQLEGLTRRRDELREALAGSEEPVRRQEAELGELLQQRVQVEGELGAARHHVEEIEEGMREHEQRRAGAEEKVQEVRSIVEQARLGWQEIKVRLQTLEEQLLETGLEQQELLQGLPEEAGEDEWREKVERIATRIQRLGPINLAAIEEFAEQSERKKYLDSQHADVTEALETLENAIRKIDRETRTRFKETFDQVNSGLQALFPRLFGGGHAYLELTGEDLLDTGVTVMARPPGKRNSSIHLLSGGEKALTAVALVFAIFQLNPAPFCLLDEVDAPLDDANVGRFCDLVREMSDHVQFIFITHNKITMALANQLMGVTMHEPGVSRLVAVDVEEAARMAAS
jgi:chromosome segregation protein